jgi:5,10-methylenetetrahydromethanopterin reductase
VTRTQQFGVVLQGVDPPDEFVATVRQIEALGYDYLWLTDSSLHARYVFAYLTLAALNTTRLRIGTAVTNPLTRHPAMIAAAMATIDEIAGGRAILGIGVGDRPLAALGFQPASLRHLEDALGAIRRLWAGETLDDDVGEIRFNKAHLRIPSRGDLPIYISASGPRTLELAGRVGDGVILLAGLFEAGVDYAMAHIQRGANAAKRARPPVAAFLYGSVRDDRALAVAEARSIAAWFPQTAPVYCELAGMSADIVAQVRRAYTGGEFQEASKAAELISDDLVTRLALAGNEADAAAKVHMLRERGVDCVNVFPLGQDRLGTIQRFAHATMA